MESTGEIVEYNHWHDNFWGDCLCDRCKHIDGENMLGKMLMAIRCWDCNYQECPPCPLEGDDLEPIF